jgi:hypothetical protein
MPAHFSVASPHSVAIHAGAQREYEDSNGMSIDPFTLHDNLMLAGAGTDSCLITVGAGRFHAIATSISIRQW